MHTRTAFSVIFILLTTDARGADEHPVQEPSPPDVVDKSRYSLLHPTPRDLWRPLSADRPDFTESPYTVDAGAVQLELSFFDFTKDGETETWAVAPANLKVGLLNNLDFQFVFDPYITTDDGAQRQDGFGDVQFRLKLNIWGNDEGDGAFAFMPYIQIPTASDGLTSEEVQGGLIFPFATELAERVGLGLMFQTDFVYDDIDESYDTEFIGTGVLGFDVTNDVGLYVEGIGIVSTDADVDFRGILGAGATYGVSENMVLDVGVNIGLTGETDDFNIFTGITVRF
ncbi:MAG: transporter [Planctomycetota bacterium]